MKPIEFKGQNLIIAKDQPEYNNLPAFHDSKTGTVVFCYKLTPDERIEMMNNGLVWVRLLTFNNPMQPIALSTKKGDFLEFKDDKENG